MKTKVCTTCGKAKSISEFYKDKNGNDGTMWRCKECSSNHHKKYYLNHKEKIKQYQIKNKDRLKETAKEWRTLNKEKVAGYEKKRRNNEKRKEYNKKYHKKYYKKNLTVLKERSTYNGEKYREEMRDWYILHLLGVHGDKDTPPELVELKRVQIQIHRELKSMGKP